jgi:hypothetical protein
MYKDETQICMLLGHANAKAEREQPFCFCIQQISHCSFPPGNVCRHVLNKITFVP